MRFRESARRFEMPAPLAAAAAVIVGSMLASVAPAQPGGGGRLSGPSPGRSPAGPSMGPGPGGPGRGHAGPAPAGPAGAKAAHHQPQPTTPATPVQPAARSAPFTAPWYAQHPDAWQHPQPYAEWRSSPVPPAVVVNAFFGGTPPANPAVAAAVASEWLPFGVFSPPSPAGTASTTFQQIAAAKSGEIKGVYFDATSNSVQTIAGRVDAATRRATWSVGASGSLSFESTLDELMKPAPAVTVVTSAGRTPGQLVLAPAPSPVR